MVMRFRSERYPRAFALAACTRLLIDAFEDSIVDFGGELAEDAVLLFPYCFGNFDDGRQTAMSRPEVPLVEGGFALGGRALAQTGV